MGRIRLTVIVVMLLNYKNGFQLGFKHFMVQCLAFISSALIMPPTSKKFGRHIGLGLSVHLGVTLALGQEPLEIGS